MGRIEKDHNVLKISLALSLEKAQNKCNTDYAFKNLLDAENYTSYIQMNCSECFLLHDSRVVEVRVPDMSLRVNKTHFNQPIFQLQQLALFRARA